MRNKKLRPWLPLENKRSTDENLTEAISSVEHKRHTSQQNIGEAAHCCEGLNTNIIFQQH